MPMLLLLFIAMLTAGAPAVEVVPVDLETKTGKLAGVIDLPGGAGPFPVVIIIAGSGPTDRDGNQFFMRNDSLKLLGQALAAKGIAALRCDKRGIGKSATAGLKEEDLRFETYVADVVAWIDWLRNDKRFYQVGIVGHSEGALIGTLAAKQAKAAAFIALAGAGRAAPEVLREQLGKNLPEEQRKKALDVLDQLCAGRAVAEPPRELAALFRPSVQPYLISWFKHDPAKAIGELTMPVLIVQGTTDIQITVADARRLAEAKKDAKLVQIEGMNHVLKHATTQDEQKAAYTDPKLPLEPELVKEVAAFLRKTMTK